jgi:hypothetical protein
VGVGLVGAGMFVTDPMNGYPAGTPDLPDPYTFTGRLHRLFSALVFIGLPVACFNLGRWFRRWQQASWAWYSIASGIGFLVAFVLASAGFAQVNGMQDLAGGFQRAALTIGWTWLTLLAVHYLRRSGPP